MNQGVMIWLIVVSFCFSRIHALSKCSSCKGASGGLKSSNKLLDMDFLMDFHYPKAMEQSEETAAKAYPLSESFDQLVTSFLSNPSTESPVVWEQRGIVSTERKTGQPLTKDQSNIGKFLRAHADDIKRDFLTMLNFRKTRQAAAKEAAVHSDRVGPYPRVRQSSGRKHFLTKRFFVSRRVQHVSKAKKFKIDPFGNFSWTPWHLNGHLVNVTKRDTSSRRMKLSDILTRAGFKKDKEEAIKVVLPLLLSDLKETPTNTNPVLPPNEEQPVPVVSSSSGKLSPMRNFKVKGDDGKEFSFSASSSDVQQLMEILAKPNSSVVLERVSLDKSRSMLKTQTERTKPTPGRKKTSSWHKGKDAVNSESVNNTEALQLKEFETSVYESIFQLDVPVRQPKSSTSCSDSAKDETKTSGDNYIR